jgi:hypothetical protein
MGVLFLFLLLAIATALVFALGAGPIAVVPLLAAVAAGVWLLFALSRGHTPGSAIRHADRPELLGPGGPDDPDRRR